jgi:hypothetical protein
VPPSQNAQHVQDMVTAALAATAGETDSVKAARHDQHSHFSRRLDNVPESLVRVHADDQVVVVRHRRGIKLGPGRHSRQRPAARIYYLGLEAVALAEYPGQHSLAASYVRDVPRIRKAVGYEARDHLKAGRISVKTVPGRHRRRVSEGSPDMPNARARPGPGALGPRPAVPGLTASAVLDNTAPRRAAAVTRRLITPWEYRHLQAVASVRFASGGFALGIGAVLACLGRSAATDQERRKCSVSDVVRRYRSLWYRVIFSPGSRVSV